TAAWCAAGVWAAVARIAAFLVDGAIAGDERIERWAVGASPRVRDRLFRARAALHAAGLAAKAWVVRTWPLFVARLAAWTSALGRHLRRAAVAAGAWLVTHRLALRHVAARTVKVGVAGTVLVVELVVAMVATVHASVLALSLSTRLPGSDVRLPPLTQRSTVYAADGSVVGFLHYAQNRQPVPLSRIAPVLIRAVIDTEDAHYWR